jgi:hypothetical protein
MDWHPITDLTPDDLSRRDSEVEGLLVAWNEQRHDLTSNELGHFLARLRREWAIETGVIEGVYAIDRGVTETLIEHGIDAGLIPHGAAQPSPERAAAMAQTHEDVLEGLFAFVKGERSLTTGYVKELHAAITRDQDSTDARDAAGHLVRTSLVRGDYKKLPNNPQRRNGTVHEYAPPEHVASEMDRLIQWHGDHVAASTPAVIESAWLHHRFTQIHPFQDGNGRVARCLASIVLVRAGGFPLVVRRDDADRGVNDRVRYIGALERADAGDLGALVTMISRRQAAAVVGALAAAVVPRTEAPDARWSSGEARRRTVRSISATLFSLADSKLGEVAAAVKARHGSESAIYYDGPGHIGFPPPVGTAFECGRRFGYVPVPSPVNDSSEWGRLALRAAGSVRELGLSFDHVAHPHRGVMAVSAALAGPPPFPTQPLGEDPFFFSYAESPEDASARLADWLDAVLADGMSRWERTHDEA